MSNLFLFLFKILQMKSQRTLPFTIQELLNSVRMRIATETFEKDPMHMKALLTELCYEVFNVTKNTVIKKYNINSSLDQFELLPLLRETNVDDLITFNIYFGLTDLEAKLYQTDPKFQLSKEERLASLDKLKSRMMEAS